MEQEDLAELKDSLKHLKSQSIPRLIKTVDECINDIDSKIRKTLSCIEVKILPLSQEAIMDSYVEINMDLDD